MRNTFKLLLIFIALGAASVSASAADAPIIVVKNGIRLSVLLSGETAEITVRAPVSGWIAVGFDPSKKMKDADLLIGYIKDGKAFARDDFGTGQISHADDTKSGGKASILSYSGTEEGGFTTITFTVARDSGDPKDAKLLAGIHKVILACSNSDNFTGIHAKRATTTIELP